MQGLCNDIFKSNFRLYISSCNKVRDAFKSQRKTSSMKAQIGSRQTHQAHAR
jgi:hypothetical protein